MAYRTPEQAKEYNRGYYDLNRKRANANSREKEGRLRRYAILALGGKCRCGCSCTDMLQIDHINPIGQKRLPNGRLHRNILQGLRDNLQVLCACCHAVKTRNGEYKAIKHYWF